MFNKILSLVSLSVLAISCGKSAHAQELIYAPSEVSNLQGSQCGDPALGYMICDADSITFYYTQGSFNRRWFNPSASGETPRIYGPYLTFPSSTSIYNHLRITGKFTILDFYGSPASAKVNPTACANWGNTHQHLFDLLLVGKCESGDTVLARRSVSVKYAAASPVTGNACSAIADTGANNVVLESDVSTNCTNFEMQVRQVYSMYENPTGFYGAPLQYLEIIGAR